MITESASLKKIAEGREAEMFEWEDGRILRLYRNGESQSAALDSQKAAFARSCGVRVPEDYGMTSVNGRSGVIIERIEGPDLLTEINNRPWRLWQVGGIWGRLQADIHTHQAPLELRPLKLVTQQKIERGTQIPDDIRTAALQQMESLPDGDRLLHGDFHPANIMRNGDEFVIIDWSNVTRGPAEADYYRSYLMGSVGDMPPGTPWLTRTFARFGRRIVRDAFDRAYRRNLTPDPSIVEQWKLPVIAARIGEGIEPEFPALFKLARQLINDKTPATP